ncbi:MAG: hypothetical protein OXH09_25115 [Gammaproteobacteria bacterium]|nr:hypothetical protein [Gammaproteobacteria bacterium]
MDSKALVGAAWAVCLVSAVGTEADQDVTIYVPGLITGTREAVWVDDACLEDKEEGCEAIYADVLADNVQSAHGELGESVGDSKGRIHVLVTSQMSAPGSYSPSEDLIEIREDVTQVPSVSTRSVYHEMGHAFVKKHLETRTGGDRNVLEHWGADEGFAFILEKKLGEQVRPPSGDSVDDILDGCGDDNQACAHDLGRLLAAVYDGVSSSLGTGKAFRYFRDAVADFDHVGGGSLVTFQEVFVNVLQEAADNEDEEEAKKAVKAVAEAFRDVADVTLPAPRIVDEDEGIDTDDIRPDTWVPPLPWWFGDSSLFVCRVVDVSNVSCVRRPDDRGDEGPRGTGRRFDPGRA